MKLLKRTKITADDNARTRAAELTLRQSLYPLALVTILFFLWVYLNTCLQSTPVLTVFRASPMAYLTHLTSTSRTPFILLGLGHQACKQHISVPIRLPVSVTPTGFFADMVSNPALYGDYAFMVSDVWLRGHA